MKVLSLGKTHRLSVLLLLLLLLLLLVVAALVLAVIAAQVIVVVVVAVLGHFAGTFCPGNINLPLQENIVHCRGSRFDGLLTGSPGRVRR